MNFPVIEIFHSIQGEGRYMGVPSFFVRVSGCNLRCVFKDSICDTPYSSFDPEKSKYKTIDDIVEDFINLKKQFPNTTHLVITGGEPMLYQSGMIEFIRKLDEQTESIHMDPMYKSYDITIETNGTINPYMIVEAALNKSFTSVIDMFSISPKLSSSVDKSHKFIRDEIAERHDRIRINYDNLAKYVYSGISYQLKFVYSGPECIDEIKEIHKELKQRSDYCEEYLDYMINTYTYLMPEGTTVNQMNEKSLECVEQCTKYGWNFAPRLHILIWGDKRGV